MGGGTKAIVFSVAVISVIIGVSSICCDVSDAASSSGLLITEVSPADEAVTISNFGTGSVDLKGYSITDGEGILEFTSSYYLGPGRYVIISKESGTDWFNSRPNTILFTSSCLTKTKSFILANTSDEVSLYHGASLVDSVCYGGSSGVGGWKGDPVPISTGHYLLRVSATDNDNSDDWISTKPGWTNLGSSGNVTFEASVAPFSFPESRGEPVLNALLGASRTIDISIYLLSSPEAVSVLCQKERDGVEVRVLLEGSPLGVDISRELSLMRSLVDSGGEVRLINGPGATDCRFTYVHNKYAIIDGESVVITSENWTSGNLGDAGNRGWGAVITSPGYSQYVERLFESDFSKTWGDVSDLLERYPNCKPCADMPPVPSVNVDLPVFASKVTPVFSPDNSFDSMKQVVNSAKERVYCEQMDLGSSYSSLSDDTPVAWLCDASSRGLDVRFILDSSQSSSSAHETYVNMIANASSVSAITVNGGDGFSLIHNKGLIVDDMVWLGSVNWTENSFTHNRESAVIMESSELADFYSRLFLKDFGINIYTVTESGMVLSVKCIETSRGQVVVLSVDGPRDGIYDWGLGDGTERTTYSGTTVFWAPVPGRYVASVHLRGTDVEATSEYLVGEVPDPEPDPVAGYAVYLAIGSLFLGITVSFLRGRKHGVKKTRKGCGRVYMYR